MYLEVHRKADGSRVGRRYCCHGCGAISPLRKRAGLPSEFNRAWVQRDEPSYSAKGNRRHGYVTNYYCPPCAALGLTAAGVAIVSRRFARPAPKRRKAPKPDRAVLDLLT